MTGATAQQILESARTMAGMSFDDLWLAYVGLGGTSPPEVVRAYLGGTADDAGDYDMLAHALNERFVEQGGNHPVPYREDM